ncbi:MAG: TonB-dependent receptor, partial [Gammaproteobacteria bacterium]
MKKTAILFICFASASYAADEPTLVITVESTKISDVSGEEVKSADVAEALVRQVPSISLVRRSGIANDIILRGQKKDNINITIDNAKVYGACPNRMDPPTSHVLANNILGIEIIEGPYDVENFGTLSGAVKITTVEPSKDFKGEASLNFGSWDYRKAAATISGGNDTARFLFSVSQESSAQYEDGDGNDFYEQIENLGAAAGVQYKDVYRDIDAYDKKTFMGKLYVDITQDQQMKLSYTANRSDDVLYPSSSMDALYDDSNIFNLDYSIKNLGEYSKSLDIQYYLSDVEHPMSTFYRNSSGLNDSANEIISALTTEMQGLKIKDTFDLSNTAEVILGLDTSNRNWDGSYIGKGSNAGITGNKSIDDVDTENIALFAQLKKTYSNVELKAGIRLDDTSITPTGSLGQSDNDYSGVSANVFSSYQADSHTKYFAGLGKAMRVPDARELYFYNRMMVEIGTPTLEQTSNYEIDFGMENQYESFKIKTKLFHSWLQDYIYYNSDSASNRFENIDATIYGLAVNGSYFASDEIYLDFGIAYQRGEKDEALTGQTDKDLAEIPPLKLNMALNYDYGFKNTARVELIAADAWTNFDADNGEQEIDSYTVLNARLKHNVTKAFELTAGIDNIFNNTYAVTNTYQDLTLLAVGGDIMILNEPGR